MCFRAVFPKISEISFYVADGSISVIMIPERIKSVTFSGTYMNRHCAKLRN